jgi:hypothetical protein
MKVLRDEFFRLAYNQLTIVSFLLLYFCLPLIPAYVVLFVTLLFSSIFMTVYWYKFATNSTLFLGPRIFSQIVMFVSFSTILFLIHGILSELFFGENLTLNIVFIIIGLLPLLYFAIVDLIDLINQIIIEFDNIKGKNFKKIFMSTVVIIGAIIFTTDLVFCIIYSFVILFGELFGYLKHLPHFTEIRDSFNTKTFVAFYNTFYFTFSIHFAIPFSGDSNFIRLQEMINKSILLSLIQIIHILFAKAIDLLILGLVANRFVEFFKQTKSNTL